MQASETVLAAAPAPLQPLLLIDNRDVEAVLTPRLTREALEVAYRDLASGEGVCRPRIDVRIPTSTAGHVYQWGSMEGGSTRGYFAVRMKSDVVYEEARGGVRTQEKFAGRRGLYCGLVLLIDTETALPLALLHDGVLQHMRVAADSAIGTAVMARPGPIRLAMIGSGGMARTHVAALQDVRQVVEVRVYSPTRAHRERFAAEMEARHGIPVRAVDDPFDACRGADVLAACTDAATTVIRREWLEPGMHVISVGGRPDDEARARFDRTLRLGTAPAPVGHPELGIAHEFLGYLARPQDAAWRAMKAGRAAPVVTGRGDDVMYADVVEGRCPGRTRDDQVTYSERGNIQGAQFHAVAGAVYEQARCRGLGRELPAEWFLQDVRD